MNRLLLLLLAFVLSGCATFDKNELLSLRGRGLPPAVLTKLEKGHPLAPADLIELRKYRVPDPWTIRQLEAHDVDSLITKNDLTALRRAGVSPAVIAATLRASDRFQEFYRRPAFDDPWFLDDPYGLYTPWPYYGDSFGAAVVLPFYGPRGHHHPRR